MVGSTSKGWKVEAISAVHEGAIVVSFVEEKGQGAVDLFVTESAEDEVAPPATAGRYAVFYSVRLALPEDGDRLARVLARAIEKNQAAPTPPGLRPYAPQPKQRHPIWSPQSGHTGRSGSACAGAPPVERRAISRLRGSSLVPMNGSASVTVPVATALAGAMPKSTTAVALCVAPTTSTSTLQP